MTLLTELVDAASGDDVALAVLLRRVKVLASRLGTGPLAEWVEHELSGYGPDVDLPDYRGPFPAQALGHFSGPFGSGVQNAPIPLVAFDQSERATFEQLFTLEFRQGVAALEDLVHRSEGSDEGLHFSWPADIVAYANMLWGQGKVHWYEGMGLVSAKTPVSVSQVAGVLDTVRTRVLDLALAIESADPAAGQQGGSTMRPEQATQIFHTTIMGGNVAIASTSFVQSIAPPASEAELLQRLTGLGVRADLVAELEAALQADHAAGDGSASQPGHRVQAWLGKVAMLSARTGGAIAVGASADVVAQLVSSFFGG